MRLRLYVHRLCAMRARCGGSDVRFGGSGVTIINHQSPGPRIRGIDQIMTAFPLFGPPPKKSTPVPPLDPIDTLPPVPKLPAPAKTKAPIAVPRAREFAAPQVVWAKAGTAPPVPFAVPTRAAPLLPEDGGVDDAPEVPNGLLGRKACDIRQRIRDINLPEIYVQGAVLSLE